MAAVLSSRSQGIQPAHEPDHCIFHRPGTLAEYKLTTTRHLRWRRWDNNRASAKGQVFVNMYGWAPVKVTLKKPRSQERVGPRTYLRIRIVDDTSNTLWPAMPSDEQWTNRHEENR